MRGLALLVLLTSSGDHLTRHGPYPSRSLPVTVLDKAQDVTRDTQERGPAK